MLKLLFWLVVGILALSYFGISLRGLVDSSAAHDNIGYVKELVTIGWDFVYNFVLGLIGWVKTLAHM
jgi:hypothetical protein